MFMKLQFFREIFVFSTRLFNSLKMISCYKHINLVVLLLQFLFSTHIYSQKVGLVLSGGGVRGMAHIGVIKALEENNIPIDYITGTSAGALVGSMYVNGKSPVEMEASVLSKQFTEKASGIIEEEFDFYFQKKETDASWITIKFGYDSLVHTRLPGSVTNSAAIDFALMENLAPVSAKANYNFDSLLVPFRCVAADIVTRNQIVFKEGDLGQAVRASMAFPLYFSPVITEDKILFDGGIYNNFPADVMKSTFSPDIIIGVNAGGDPEIPVDDNVLSQVKSILIPNKNYFLSGPEDILITPSISRFGVFEFKQIQAAIDSGYAATMRKMDQIKKAIVVRRSPEEVNLKRQKLHENLIPVFIDKTHVTGLRSDQEAYVQSVINPTNECIPIGELKKSFFKLAADDNVRYIFPKLEYNPSSGYYDLNLLIKREKDLRVDFGGNFSSKPINQAFIGFQYNLWGKQSIRFLANSYFGKLYSSGRASMRMDIPGRLPFFIEPSATLNQYDYFKSNATFFEDVKPSYLVLFDASYAMTVGIPVRNKAKLTGEGALIDIQNRYYQTREFLTSDTSDQTNFTGYTVGLGFERNTLNRKMYAAKGSGFFFKGRFVEGDEESIPGSTSLKRDTVTQFSRWLQLRIIYDTYMKTASPLTFGFYTDLFFSGQPFLANYTATIISASAFEPIPESRTLFLPNFRAYNYLGAGLKTILKISNIVDFRVEGYIFQPFQEILNDPATGKAYFGEALLTRYYMASSNLVFHSPVGPLSVSVNYYDEREKPFSFLFHFGYILFNKKALD